MTSKYAIAMVTLMACVILIAGCTDAPVATIIGHIPTVVETPIVAPTGPPVLCYYKTGTTPECTDTDYRNYYVKYTSEPYANETIVAKANELGSVENIVAFVQNMPYDYEQEARIDNDKNTDQSYPYQTLEDDTGVCEEKALLMAEMLKDAGYNASIFRFEKEGHAAVGLATNGPGYKGTGYNFIETTAVKEIGDSDITFTNGAALTSMPKVYQISTGNTYAHVYTPNKTTTVIQPITLRPVPTVDWNQIHTGARPTYNPGAIIDGPQ